MFWGSLYVPVQNVCTKRPSLYIAHTDHRIVAPSAPLHARACKGVYPQVIQRAAQRATALDVCYWTISCASGGEPVSLTQTPGGFPVTRPPRVDALIVAASPKQNCGSLITSKTLYATCRICFWDRAWGGLQPGQPCELRRGGGGARAVHRSWSCVPALHLGALCLQRQENKQRHVSRESTQEAVGMPPLTTFRQRQPPLPSHPGPGVAVLVSFCFWARGSMDRMCHEACPP